ncbi:MAG: AgmX/PglI C-terminal domain-containing protein [Methylotenera sp.]|nr:AgmX/PglI C-terminal domain-containing protein [Oligoflexia bacterium]
MSTPTNPTSTELPNSNAEKGIAVPKNLVVLSLVSPNQGRIFKLHKERIVIGSVVSADIQLQGEGVSPIHAVIEMRNEVLGNGVAATAYDLASDTGLFINGEKIITQGIKTGDEITIGGYKLKFAIEDVKAAVAQAVSAKIPERVREAEGRALFSNPEEDMSHLILEDEANVIPIFDYRGTHLQALEVVMSWRNTIMDIEHFVKEKSVTVGAEQKSDFGIPPILSSGLFPIMTRMGDEYTLNLNAQMKGVVQSQGKLQTLEQLQKVSNQVTLKKNDFAKVSVGEVAFYFSYTAAPPRLKRPKLWERDALMLKILVSSLLFTALAIVGLNNTPIPANLEAEQVPERIATILYQPEKYTARQKLEKEVLQPAVTPPPEPVAQVEPKKEPPKVTKVEITPKPVDKTKPVPKNMNASKNGVIAAKKPSNVATKAASNKSQNMAKEGEGARAKGTEGTRGKKNAAANAEHQELAKRPSANGGPGNGGGRSQIQDQGNLDLLKGATSQIKDLLGNTAASLGSGGQKLQGFGGFNTLGNGGKALSGNGAGGGGTADSLGGLGNKGRGGGRVGTGLGAAGNGNGIIGGKARVTLQSGGPEETVVMGSIDKDAIEAALMAHRDEFRLCYEREINGVNSSLAGRVSTSFVIGSSGRVNQAGVESTTLKNANVERCILTVIKRIDFPIPNGGGIVQVTYPFKFSAGK